MSRAVYEFLGSIGMSDTGTGLLVLKGKRVNGDDGTFDSKGNTEGSAKVEEIISSPITKVQRRNGLLYIFTMSKEHAYIVKNENLKPSEFYSGTRVARYALIAYHITTSSRAKRYLRSYMTQPFFGNEKYELWTITVDIPHIMEGGGNVPLAVTRNSRPNLEALELYN